MLSSFRQLDRLLRGDLTRPADLVRGSIETPLFGMSLVVALLAAFYGLCMGSFSLFRAAPLEEAYLWEVGGHVVPIKAQLVASTVKVPLLFLLTLVVTFPSLYVFNALVGSRLTIVPVLRLLVAAMGIMLAVLASLGPIVAFFGVCTTNYPFMVLLNVVVFAVSGLLGLGFLLQTLHRLSVAQAIAATPPTPPPSADDEPVLAEAVPGPLERIDPWAMTRNVKTVFRIWIVLFGVVGAQMGWVLRPFVGDPTIPFTWFRPRESNFFEAVIRALQGCLADSVEYEIHGPIS